MKINEVIFIIEKRIWNAVSSISIFLKYNVITAIELLLPCDSLIKRHLN